MNGVFFAQRPLMRRRGGCPVWSGTPLTVDTTPLSGRWNRATSMYNTTTLHTLALGSIIRVKYCQTRAVGTEMSLAITPDDVKSFFANFQTDNNFVLERYSGLSTFDGVFYGIGPGVETIAGVNGLDFMMAVGNGAHAFRLETNPGTSIANIGTVYNATTHSYIGSSNRIVVGPGSNGLGAIVSLDYVIDPPRLTPSIVQRASRRGDGTIALPSAPTPGNLMLFVMGGFSGSAGSYVPSGFSSLKPFDGDANNRVWAYARFVVAGDTGSYSVSASDNQGCTLLEIADADFAVPMSGGNMTSAFSGSSFSLAVTGTSYDSTSLKIVAMEQDPVRPFTVTPATGLTTEYLSPTDGLNHAGAIVSLTSAFSGNVTGSISGGSSSGATHGQWIVLGRVA